MADEIVRLNYLNHNAVPGKTPDREGLKAFVAYLRAAFPDIHFTIEDQLAEGDKVVTRWAVAGTQQGEFAGIRLPASLGRGQLCCGSHLAPGRSAPL